MSSTVLASRSGVDLVALCAVTLSRLPSPFHIRGQATMELRLTLSQPVLFARLLQIYGYA